MTSASDQYIVTSSCSDGNFGGPALNFIFSASLSQKAVVSAQIEVEDSPTNLCMP